MGKTLLSVGTNFTLIHLRNIVFVNAGYKVLSARSGAVALKFLASEPLNGVIARAHVMTQPQTIGCRGVQNRSVSRSRCSMPARHEECLLNADATLVGLDGAARIVEVLGELIPNDSKWTQVR